MKAKLFSILFVVVISNFLFIDCIITKNYQFIRGRRFHKRLWQSEDATIPERWFTQRLDHFDEALTKTWKQRYWVNQQYFDQEHGPVFLMIGGEGEENPIWMTNGYWIDLAKEFNALCVLVEHRYYGKSHPTDDLSTENMAYLSSEQALADLASFRTFIHKSYNLTDSNRWISFGGSYPGSLSAWFRLKYPHLVYASVASSAPMLAVVDFTDYKVVVNKSLSAYHPECSIEVAKAVNLLQSVMKSPNGTVYLHRTFNTCELLESENDKINFYSTLAGNFEDAVQYNKDNRAFEGAIGVTIDLLCDTMMNQHEGDQLHRYASVNSIILNLFGQNCLDASYDSFIEQMKQTSWNESAAVGGRQWIYQTCTEFGFFQTTDSANQPFGQTIPVDFFIQQCKDIFGEKFSEKLLNESVYNTNINYGGYDYQGSRVVFVNGQVDPWHALSFTGKPPNEFAQTIFIEGTAHCSDMYPQSSQNDLPSLKHARTLIHNLISNWLKQKN